MIPHSETVAKGGSIVLKRILVGILLLLVLVASSYLLWRTFSLIETGAATGPGFCAIIFGIPCDDVLIAESSWILGVPWAGWGLIHFAALAALLIIGWQYGEGVVS